MMSEEELAAALPAQPEAGEHPLELAVKHCRKGLELAERGSWQDAVSEFTDAIGFNPKYVEAYAQRGFAYSELGLTEEAIGDLETAKSFSLDPENNALLEAAINKLRAGGEPPSK